jgi:hypothetical protein
MSFVDRLEQGGLGRGGLGHGVQAHQTAKPQCVRVTKTLAQACKIHRIAAIIAGLPHQGRPRSSRAVRHMPTSPSSWFFSSISLMSDARPRPHRILARRTEGAR